MIWSRPFYGNWQLEPSLFSVTTITYQVYAATLGYSHFSKYFNIVVANFSTAFYPGPPAFAGAPASVPRRLGI